MSINVGYHTETLDISFDEKKTIEPKKVRNFDNSFDNLNNDNDTIKPLKCRTPPRGIGDTATNSRTQRRKHGTKLDSTCVDSQLATYEAFISGVFQIHSIMKY